MAKSKGKAVKTGDGGTAGGLDRTARIALGRQVLAAVQTRIDTYLMDSGRAGMGSGGKRVTEKTRKKYEDEEIENTAFDKRLEPKNLRVSVDLARLTDRLADPDAPDLAATVESGLLRLTVPLLAELLKRRTRSWPSGSASSSPNRSDARQGRPNPSSEGWI